MVPDIDLQLQVVLKALEQTVRPALDPSDTLAAEQLGLAIATLSIVRGHVPLQRRFARRLLEDALRLAENVDPPDVLASGITSAKAILLDPEAEAEDIEACRNALNQRIATTIAETGQAGMAAFGSLFLTGCRAPVQRMRSWVSGAGFEPDAADLLPIETALARS
jgi:hypothetical protein